MESLAPQLKCGFHPTVMVQDFPGPTPLPQLLVWEKFPSLIVMPVMFNVVLPVSVSVVACGGEHMQPPNGPRTQEKPRLAGLSSTTVPVPVTLTFCGLPGALSVTETVPVLVPLCVGLKVTLIAQLFPAARLEPQLFDSLKSPLAFMLVILSVFPPWLVSVTDWAGLLVPTS